MMIPKSPRIWASNTTPSLLSELMLYKVQLQGFIFHFANEQHQLEKIIEDNEYCDDLPGQRSFLQKQISCECALQC
jgi:hypothetical protein